MKNRKNRKKVFEGVSNNVAAYYYFELRPYVEN